MGLNKASKNSSLSCVLQVRELNDNNGKIEPQDWLSDAVDNFEKEANRQELNIPKTISFDNLEDDQQMIVAEVMKTLQDWMTCEDLSTFQPLRMVVNGAGGSGKSVVLDTIVATMRTMFQRNDVVKVVAPTGVAACNVGGETFHHMLEMGIESSQYVPFSMNGQKKQRLIGKFKNMLALLIDERSLLPSKLFGTCEQVLTETIYEGEEMLKHSFGGLPIVILFGDDYQLPAIGEGALHALYKSRSDGKMTVIGRREFLASAEHVMELKSIKRMDNNKLEQKALLGKLRETKALEPWEIEKLLSLHLDVIKANHGDDVVNKIRKEAIYLYFRNEKKSRKNLECIRELASRDNPVAIMAAHSTSPCRGRGIRGHYNTDSPEASILCVGAKAALNLRNFCPLWGLHNGACGTVVEIVFANGKNPNHGDLPEYVVVEFPNYTGPVWDKQNDKVCFLSFQFLHYVCMCTVS